MFRAVDDLLVLTVLGAAAGLGWFAAIFDVVRRPGSDFPGLSRRAWLALLVFTGFVGAACWGVRRLVAGRG